MNFDTIVSVLARLFFAGGFALLGIAVIELGSNLFGATVLRGMYTAGRLMELSAVLMIFTAALLLRQIREVLSARH